VSIVVLHLMTRDAYEALAPDAPITNPSLESEGFIHCTDEPAVLLQVANAFYRGVAGDFVALHVAVADLTSACIWEEPAHINGAGEAFAPSFPHVYGHIDRRAVLRVDSVTRDADGAFVGYVSAPKA
jgi:uncharacterized protein (DUF952 family)